MQRQSQIERARLCSNVRALMPLRLSNGARSRIGTAMRRHPMRARCNFSTSICHAPRLGRAQSGLCAGSALVALAAASPLHAASVCQPGCVPAETVLFKDYFTRPNDTNWIAYNRYDRIALGRLWMDGAYQPNSVGRDGWVLTHVGDKTWTDYTYRVFYDSEKAGDPHHMVTVYFHVAAEDG